jgi:hypothetical protein
MSNKEWHLRIQAHAAEYAAFYTERHIPTNLKDYQSDLLNAFLEGAKTEYKETPPPGTVHLTEPIPALGLVDIRTTHPQHLQHCLIDGCERRPTARGLCAKHYQVARNHGKLDTLPKLRES